jgi:hypothetical protein
MKRTLLVLSIAVAISCGSNVDLQKALRVERLSTGWIDAGVVNGQHKIVPAATFTLKNVSNQKRGLVQVNAVFRQVNDSAEWSSAFVPAAANELPPGASSATIVVKGEKGYTGADPPDVMLKNAQFVDAKVEIYVKSGSSMWTKLVESPIARQLLQLP